MQIGDVHPRAAEVSPLRRGAFAGTRAAGQSSYPRVAQCTLLRLHRLMFVEILVSRVETNGQVRG